MSVEGPQMAMVDTGLRPLSDVDDVALHNLTMDGGHGGEDTLTEPVLQAIEEGFVGNPDQGTTDQQEQEVRIESIHPPLYYPLFLKESRC